MADVALDSTHRGWRGWVRRGHLRDVLIVVGCLIADPQVPWLLAAWAVLLPGAMLHLWAKGCLRIGEELTTSGPYRWTRNPFYLANLLIDLGVCLAVRRPELTAAYLVLFFIVYRRKIREEEAYLLGAHGERYRDFCRQVPRFFPYRFGRRTLPPSGGFSWSNPNLVQGKEYARLLRVVTLPFWVWGAGLGIRWFRAGEAAPPELRARFAEIAAVLAVTKIVELGLSRWLRRRRRDRRRAAGPASPPIAGPAGISPDTSPPPPSAGAAAPPPGL